VASVLFVSEDASMMVQLLDGLEAAEHRVTWVNVKEGVPARQKKPPDVVVLDHDSVGMNVVEAAKVWRATDPAPAIVVVGGATPAAEKVAQAASATLHKKPLDAAALGAALARAAERRFVGALTPGSALHAIGAKLSSDPLSDATAVLAGSRSVDFEQVRDALRPFADAYVTVGPMVEKLRAERALTVPEVNLALVLDGSRTLRTVAQSGIVDAQAALRCLWALTSTGAAQLTSEPPEDEAHPAARVVARARRRLRARSEVVQKARTHFDLLEVDADPNVPSADVEAAARACAVWYSPERLAGLDLGDLAGVVGPYWQQLLKARELLVEPSKARRYFYWLVEHGVDVGAELQERRMKRQEAEECFGRGTVALTEGDAFRAVSQLAQAARIDPDNPDYEAYAAWARYMAELARGNDTLPAVVRGLAHVEQAMLGRRPRPRALYAMGLLAQVAADLDAARNHLRDAIACDPTLHPAQRALARLTGGAGKTPRPQGA
jgi:CheY-like chemotaxis protein/tetratricopeptide (TPR) repeat protein